MPGKVKVKIISGKNLPIMDRSNDTTDAYVEIKLGNITYKTEVCRRTLHPRWNTDWYRFELDDSELQDEPLQIRLMDHDTYSANDAIGKVYLNLNPLLLPAAGQLAVGDNNPHHEISGWIPVYDTMHGIRGEVNVTVKVELFSDFNKFRQSSCGIKFFYSQCIPQGYQVKVINGFVEELIVDDDPEYQWIDKIRTPRASNEARQTLFFKLSGELQRKIGVKAINLGGNAVIGYKQCFDLEGESGIVARGIGTAVTLVKAVLPPNSVVESREGNAEKYLKFVGDGKRFSLGTPLHSHFRLKMPIPLSLSPPSTKRIPKKLSQRLYSSLDSGNLSSVSSPSVFHDDNILKVLLEKEHKKRDSAISKKFQKFRHSQKSLYRKMYALRAKLGDSIGEGAEPSTTNKRSAFKRATSDSGAMAEFLARSVIQATNSLSCILEAQAPLKVEDTMESLEPLSNLLSKTEQSSVRDNISDDGSDTSSETTSDSDYDDSEKNNNDVETISNIVSNVEKLQRRSSKGSLKKQYSLPLIPVGGFSAINEIDFPPLSKYKRPKLLYQKKKGLMIETSFSSSSDHQICDDIIKRDNVQNTYNIPQTSKKSYLSNSSKDHANFLSIDLTTLNKSGKLRDTDNLLIAPVGDVEPIENNVIQSAMHTMLLERLNCLDVVTLPNIDTNKKIKYDFKDSNINLKPQYSFKNFSDKKSIDASSSIPSQTYKSGILENYVVTPLNKISLDDRDYRQGKDIKKLQSLNDSFSLVSTQNMEDVIKVFKNDHLTTKSTDEVFKNFDLDNKHPVKMALKTVLLDDFNKQTLIQPSVKTSQGNLSSNSKYKICDLKYEYLDPMTTNVNIEKSTILGKTTHVDNGNENLNISDENQSTAEGLIKDICDKLIKNSAIFDKSANDFNGSGKLVDEEMCEQIDEKDENSGKEKINNLIAPVDTDTLNAKPKHIVRTAMQLMLLDKLNTMGASTPPASPAVLDSSKSFSMPENKEQLANTDDGNPQKKTIPKSFSSINFGRYTQPEELDFTDKSDTFSCFSDTDLNEPTTEKQGLKKKRKFRFFKLKFNKEVNHSFKLLGSKGEKDNEIEHKNILSKMFYLKHQERTLKDTETQTSMEFLDNTSSPALSTSSNTKCVSKIQSFYPGSTDVKPGLFHTNSITNTACITPNRQSSSPIHQETNGPGTSHPKKEDSPDRTPGKQSYSPIKLNASALLHRRSSDSDLSITPKGNSLTGSDRSGGHTAAVHMRNHYVRKNGPHDNFEMMEYPFLTMNSFPANFVVHIGSSVSSKSVKVLERISNIEEPESRDSWWSEIRMEIRAHARSLNCNAVLGYIESASIYEDVCVLSASGTAAVVDLSNISFGIDEDSMHNQRNAEKDGTKKVIYESPEHNAIQNALCRISHLPYDDQNVPANAKVLRCPMCSKGRVPEVLMVTIEPPDNLPSVGKGCFIECHVSRPLRDGRGESIAKEISEGLPFLEYELHRLLVNKLKIKGMNAIFSLKIRYSMGDKMLMAIATGTAMYLSSLHAPTLPVLVSDRVSDEKIVAGLQEMLIETIKKNREIYEIKDDFQTKVNDVNLEDGQATLDLAYGNKDCSILEMDDPEDAEVVNLLMEDKVPDGFHVVNTESVPGLDDLEIVKNLQMFIQIYRAKISPNHNLQKHFQRLLQSVYFKLRRMAPCALCDLQFMVDIPDSDEIQLCIIGMALGLGKKVKKRALIAPKNSEDDLIFKLDEDTPQDTPIHGIRSNSTSLKYRPNRSPLKLRNQSLKQRHIPHKERHGVDITPLSYVPGGNIEQYLGNLNFFFIRETTSIREEGGLSGFIHSFITEVLAIVRSHVSALGGNALVAFFITECVLNHNLHKNQGQCLINVGGDVVSVSYQDEA